MQTRPQAFLRTPDDFWESIFACIEVGGDTDTVAASCGALAGAYVGLAAIEAARPDAGHVLTAIQDSEAPGTADVPALRKLAKRLYEVAVGAPATPSWVAKTQQPRM